MQPSAAGAIIEPPRLMPDVRPNYEEAVCIRGLTSETFMRYEAKDQVFVAMPFTGTFRQAFERVIEPAIRRVTVKGRPLSPADHQPCYFGFTRYS